MNYQQITDFCMRQLRFTANLSLFSQSEPTTSTTSAGPFWVSQIGDMVVAPYIAGRISFTADASTPR